MNYLGTYTLFKKEVLRFIKVYNQTLIAPVITGLLFLAVFQLAIGERVNAVGEVPFGVFMASGLIIMTVVQQAFANTSSSLIMGKVLGNIIDYLMPPLSAGEIIFAMVMASVLRGLLIAMLAGIAIYIFVPFSVYSFPIMIFYLFFAAMMLALLGLFAGVFAESFDQMAAVTSYIITPLAFLSGTFYSIKNLPGIWAEIAYFNPFFYMIDGFRYGMTGYADGNLAIGAITLLSCIVFLWVAVYIMISKGYRLKT
ncbi:MAG: multidrug ABC transporter permease [Alphaproteobacteria bacterium CG11_big_fil_rev_8_21_14_0_20_44_7]|nr:MAG: multidrug ABC transporter permease [Alphaproteobacteria bacterium CG11_big_fil_rev_8_21_14_0_20_44_7]